MPRKVYMPDQYRMGGGTTFHVSWSRIENFLRGKDVLSETNAALKPNEHCEFVVTATGINVYVDKEGE